MPAKEPVEPTDNQTTENQYTEGFCMYIWHREVWKSKNPPLQVTSQRIYHKH